LGSNEPSQPTADAVAVLTERRVVGPVLITADPKDRVSGITRLDRVIQFAPPIFRDLLGAQRPVLACGVASVENLQIYHDWQAFLQKVQFTA
jgi:hypothetical protein